MRETTFHGLTLATRTGRVMTPRPATEALVAAALDRIGRQPARVVDVGTGTGAVAVAIAAAAPRARVFATDTSRCAVALARENVLRHGVADRVTVLHGDLLEPVRDPIDLVVANLPYLAAGDAHRYPDLVREPHGAVFAPGDGLGPYRRLLDACAARLDGDAGVVIQLHRRILAATVADLAELRARLDAPEQLPQAAAA